MKRRQALKLIAITPLLPEVPWKALLPPAKVPLMTRSVYDWITFVSDGKSTTITGEEFVKSLHKGTTFSDNIMAEFFYYPDPVPKEQLPPSQ